MNHSYKYISATYMILSQNIVPGPPRVHLLQVTEILTLIVTAFNKTVRLFNLTLH